jgi:hypothetical protein
MSTAINPKASHSRPPVTGAASSECAGLEMAMTHHARIFASGKERSCGFSHTSLSWASGRFNEHFDISTNIASAEAWHATCGTAARLRQDQ